LITVVDRSVEVARGQARFSTALWARAAEHAQAVTGLIAPGDVHSWRRARRSGLGAVIAALLAGVASSMLPVGPLDAVDILMGRSAASVRLAAAAAASAEERALVGDITLRYVYPDYMGMEPVSVPNSDGTIHAPPGTRVEIKARTADRFDAAAIQVDDDEPLDAGLDGGRDLTASITVQMEGAWRFLLFESDEVQLSPDYKIIVEADQAPVVVTSATGEVARALDEPLGLGWQVTDDYGIRSVVMEITDDAGTRQVKLRTPIDSVAELSGRIRKTPAALGLKPGDKVTLQIVAMDSDKASGGNRGESAELVLEVLGPKGIGQRLTAYHKKLREVLLVALADFLEDAVPPAQDPRGMLRWARNTRDRLDPVREVYKDKWGENQSTGVDGVLVREVMEASGRLYRFTVVNFDTGGGVSGRRAVEKDYRTFGELHGETVAALEHAVWVIDSMLQQVNFRQVAALMKSVAQEATELANLADDDPDAQQLLARLDQLERLMATLSKSASELSEGQFKEFLNSQMSEAQNQMDAIRQAIAAGRMEDAQRMLEELAQQLNRFAEGMQDQMQQGQQGDNELAERMKKLMEDLKQLGEEQAALADELAAARELHGGQLDEVMGLWSKLDKLSNEAVERSSGMLAEVGTGEGWSASSIRRAEVTGQEVRGTRDAVRARDARGSLERVMDAQRYGAMTERAFGNEGRYGPQGPTGQPEGLKGAKREVRAVLGLLSKMREVLEEIERQPGESNPALQNAARQLSGQQSQLNQRQQTLAEEVQTVERAMPTGDGSAQENMRGAGEAMDGAKGALDRGEAMRGEGQQREAARRLQEVQDSLQQAAAKQQQMQRDQQRMEGEGEGRQPQDGEGQDPSHLEQPEIPTPEAFETPEEYRRALLEGMAEDVPEEFEALKKRFYEELVRQ